MAPGMARVWFLRPAGSINGNVWAATPMISANGAPIGDIPAGSDFYRDFQPGTYSFAVQPYGLPTGTGARDADLSRHARDKNVRQSPQ